MLNPLQLDKIEIKSALPDSAEAWPKNRAVTLANRPLLRRLSRQPLVHFLLAGVVLFGAASLLERKSNSDSGAIHVNAAQINRLEEVWSRQYGRNPSPSEMRSLIDDYVREEIYYREAMASGLDKDDSIIRRRLVEKMEFLSQEIAGGEPAVKDLQAYFDRNRQEFEVPAQIAFSHVFFSPAKHGVALQDDANKALALLHNARPAEESKLGDAFMLQSEYPLQNRAEIKALFGEEFAARLFESTPGQWRGPVRSSYGVHLVRVNQFTPAHAPQLADVRTQVVTEFKNERLQAASEKYYARLRERYRVDVDGTALAATLSSEGATRRSAQKSAPDED
jgi:hypothetical protein